MFGVCAFLCVVFTVAVEQPLSDWKEKRLGWKVENQGLERQENGVSGLEIEEVHSKGV